MWMPMMKKMTVGSPIVALLLLSVQWFARTWFWASLLVLWGTLAQVARADVAPFDWSENFANFGKTGNTSCGVCAAAVAINSFIFLENQYPEIYGNNLTPNVGGTKPSQTDPIDRGTFAAYFYGLYGPLDGAYLGYIDAKMAWINGDPANNLMGHAPGSTLFDSYQNPTIQDLASENGEDVEIFVNGGSLGYHALTLTGVSCTGANYTNCSISYQNPNFPTINVGNVGVSNVGGSLQLNAGFGDLGNIVDAFSESPVPEPNSLILLGTAIAGLAWRMRRKTS
jgi:hypothetical protein